MLKWDSLENADKIREKLYPKILDPKPCKFEVNDVVRIPKHIAEPYLKKKFKERGNDRNWSKDLFVIVASMKTQNGVCIFKPWIK